MEQSNDVSNLKQRSLVSLILFLCIVKRNFSFRDFLPYLSDETSWRHHVDCRLRLTGHEHVYYYVIGRSPVTQQLPSIAQYGGHAALWNSWCYAERKRCRDKKGKLGSFSKCRIILWGFCVDWCDFNCLKITKFVRLTGSSQKSIIPTKIRTLVTEWVSCFVIIHFQN